MTYIHLASNKKKENIELLKRIGLPEYLNPNEKNINNFIKDLKKFILLKVEEKANEINKENIPLLEKIDKLFNWIKIELVGGSHSYPEIENGMNYMVEGINETNYLSENNLENFKLLNITFLNKNKEQLEIYLGKKL